MPLLKRFITLGLFLAASSLYAETTSCTDAVGFLRTTAPNESDINTGTSLVRPSVYTGSVKSASGSTISVTGNPGWVLGEFTYAGDVQPNTYYARIGDVDGTDHPYAGRIFTIEVAGSDSLIVTDPVDGPLDSLPAGAKIEIIPYWTLNTLFPHENAGISFIPTVTPMDMKTMVLFRDRSAVGVNFPLSKVYYYREGKWRLVGGAYNDDFGNTVIYPDMPFTVRNTDSESLEIIHSGYVLAGYRQTQVRANIDAVQDNHLVTGMPVPVKLRDLNLAGTPAFRLSAGPFDMQDVLLLYRNDTLGYTKSASAVYYNVMGVWKKAGGVYVDDFGDDTIAPDVSFIIRRSAVEDSAPVFWRLQLQN
jgi:uncharacterized protein (TIGR02597 family)